MNWLKRLWRARYNHLRYRHVFTNNTDGPTYISIEPWPECYELEPGDELALLCRAPLDTDRPHLEINQLEENQLQIYPCQLDGLEVLINGQSAEGRSWDFKHR